MAKSKTKTAKALKSKAQKPKAQKPNAKLKLKGKAADRAGTAKTKTKSNSKTSSKSSSKSTSKAKPAAKAKPKLTAKPAAVQKSATLKVVPSKRTVSVRLQPTDDRILVQRKAAELKTAGGLYIPDTATERPNSGTVIAVGRGHRDKKGRIRPCDVKPGDQVLFRAYAGVEVELDGEEFILLRETELVGIEA